MSQPSSDPAKTSIGGNASVGAFKPRRELTGTLPDQQMSSCFCATCGTCSNRRPWQKLLPTDTPEMTSRKTKCDKCFLGLCTTSKTPSNSIGSRFTSLISEISGTSEAQAPVYDDDQTYEQPDTVPLPPSSQRPVLNKSILKTSSAVTSGAGKQSDQPDESAQPEQPRRKIRSMLDV